MSLAITNTTFGTVSRGADRTVVSADGNTLRDWATRGDYAWPGSALARYDEVTAAFVDGDLVELAVIESGRDSEAEDLAADELNAWASECLIRAGYPNHPAIRAPKAATA